MNKEELILCFQSCNFYKHMDLSTKDDPKSLTNLLWEGKEHWIEDIFGIVKNSMKKYQVKALMHLLIAAEIISWVGMDGVVFWCLNEVRVNGKTKQVYQIAKYWKGINLI